MSHWVIRTEGKDEHVWADQCDRSLSSTSGKSIDLRGDGSPPIEAELDQIFATVNRKRTYEIQGPYGRTYNSTKTHDRSGVSRLKPCKSRTVGASRGPASR